MNKEIGSPRRSMPPNKLSHTNRPREKTAQTTVRSARRGSRVALLFAAAVTATPAAPSQSAADTSGPVSTASTGARCIGASFDDTEAFQTAIDTGRTVYAPALGGSCRITRALVMKTRGQIFYGDGRARTKIAIEPGIVGEGVFVAKTGEPGPVWRDFSIAFSQPDTNNRTKLAHYPPAFFVADTPRFEMEHLGCYVATVCVDMKGNSGGATIADFQMSAFEVGIDIDGSLDTVRLLSLHAWPFGAAGSQQIKMMGEGVTWVRLGRVDDIKISNSLFLMGTGIAAGMTPSGTPTGSITNTDFDGEHRAIVMSGGNLSITGGYFASAGPVDQQVILSGGTLGIYGATMGCTSGVTTSLPTISVNGVDAHLSVIGSPSFVCGGDDHPILAIWNGTAIFSDNNIQIEPNKSYVHPKIELFGARSRLIATGNRISDKGEGDGMWISIESDGLNRIFGNVAPGWRSLLAGKPMPTTTLIPSPGVYFAN